MTETGDRAGAKWFAGLVLAVLLTNMGGGLLPLAYADEGDTSTSTEVTSTDTPAETEESTSQSEEENTQEAPQPEEEGDEGEDGTDGEPTEEESAQDGEDADEPGEVAGDGENGEDGNATSTSDGTPADIETGDAEAGAQAGGIVNVTDIDTNASSTPNSSTGSSTTPVVTPDTASTTDPLGDTSGTTPAPEAISTPENGGSGSADLEIDQDVTASTTLGAEGNTGENTITDPDGGEIDTGDGEAWGQDNFFFNIALVDSSLQIHVLLNPTESELDFRNQLIDFFTFNPGSESGGEECVKFYNCGSGDELNATSTGSAHLNRDMDVLCNSGDNYGGLISTGDCAASGVMTTMGNWFAFNSNLMVLLVNQIGDLNADVVLPEPSFFEGMRKGGVAAGSDLTVDQNASSTVNGSSLANTGDNTGEQGVLTGEADADAATISMINQFNPLTCFIVAVGGKWNGEIYQLPQGFQSEKTPFGSVICGRGSGVGDLEEINAVVKHDLEMVVDALVLANTGTNSGEFVMTGDAKSFLTILNVVNTVFINQDWMLGLFTISGDWNGDLTFGARPDASPAEQTAGDLVSGKKNKKKYVNSGAELTKTSSTVTATSNSTVEYTITLKNEGNKIYRAVLEDKLTNPLGAVVNTQKWDLGTVMAGEEIVVEYEVAFSGNLVAGEYTNSVKLTGRARDNYGTDIRPIYASAAITLTEGEVLGVTECPAYLTSYITPGGANDPEQVRLLESFLGEGRGENIIPDGVYDAASIAAVKRFQGEHAGDILSPWGVGAPTGHVFYTTRKKINELYCHGEKEFPLSSLQVEQIQLYRNGVLQPNAPTSLFPSSGTPWSAIDFPLLSELNLFAPLASAATTPATTGFFSEASISSHPFLALLRGIFDQIASGFSIGKAQAAENF